MHINGPDTSLIAVSNIAEGIQRLMTLGLPSEWAECVALASLRATELEASSPLYLELPAAVALLASDRLYEPARPHGRLCYRDGMYAYDEARGELIYAPVKYCREQIYEFLRDTVLAHERPLMLLPLGWRVGFCVGWLSGLAVPQKDEAQAGLVLLAALVPAALVADMATRAAGTCSGR